MTTTSMALTDAMADLERAVNEVETANTDYVASLERLALAEYDLKRAEALQGESYDFKEYVAGVAVTSQAYKDKRLIWVDGHCTDEMAELFHAEKAKREAEAALELARDHRSIARRWVDAALQGEKD